MFKKLKEYLKKSLIKINLLIIGLIILALLETLSISSIPLFISFIINPELFVERLSNLGILPNAVLEFIASYKSLFFINLIVITLFVLKNIYFLLLFIFKGLF